MRDNLEPSLWFPDEHDEPPAKPTHHGAEQSRRKAWVMAIIIVISLAAIWLSRS